MSAFHKLSSTDKVQASFAQEVREQETQGYQLRG
jgi:hypothetical protein